jgi:hypothetical protein
MELEQKMSAEKRKEFEGFCEECDKYQSQRLNDDVNKVHQNGDAVFTRAHYEVLGTFLHAVVANYLKVLRRDCAGERGSAGERRSVLKKKGAKKNYREALGHMWGVFYRSYIGFS